MHGRAVFQRFIGIGFERCFDGGLRDAGVKGHSVYAAGAANVSQYRIVRDIFFAAKVSAKHGFYKG